MTDWFPIESAPKDGTVIDLWCLHEDGEGFRVADAFWGDYVIMDPPWKSGPDWVTEHEDGVNIPVHHKPTHWMPLPEPPTSS